jgi:peptidoglycan/LPS O-acetylase OafA/YrhL
MRRRPELDGLRGVAILLVVFAHAVQGVTPSNRGLAPSIGSLGGVAGVQLFFVLSGYLITGVLLRGGGLRLFYARRVRRLYPTLIVAVLVALLWTGDAGGALRAMTYIENLGMDGGTYVLSHTWSLAVEEQFYLVWPVLLLAARRHAVWVAVGGVLATWGLQQTVGWADHAVYVGLRWDAVLAGCALALVPWKPSGRWFMAGMVVLSAYTLGLVTVGRTDYMVLTLASVALVAGAAQVPVLSARWLVHVGHISYALYLWHVLAMRLDIPTPVALLLGWGLAEVTYQVIDRHSQRSPLRHPSDSGEVLDSDAGRAERVPVVGDVRDLEVCPEQPGDLPIRLPGGATEGAREAPPPARGGVEAGADEQLPGVTSLPLVAPRHGPQRTPRV